MDLCSQRDLSSQIVGSLSRVEYYLLISHSYVMDDALKRDFERITSVGSMAR